MRASLILGIAVLSVSAALGISRAHAAEPVGPKVMAFYYTWYGAPPVSGTWLHWPEGGHNPDHLDAKGLPDIGATNHPRFWPYDAGDPKLIDHQLELANRAGVDVLISTWWFRDDNHDRNLHKVLDRIDATGSKVRMSAYYETIDGESAERAIEGLRYIAREHGKREGFFKLDGLPVIFVYGRAMGQIAMKEWDEVCRALKDEAVLVADRYSKSAARTFAGVHTYNPVGLVVNNADMAKAYNSAVKLARTHGKISCLTVIPGYDDSNIGRSRVTVAERKAGKLYEDLWKKTIAAQPDWILITSWNEWHEGSEIEPSVENGDMYIEMTARFSRLFRSRYSPPD